MTTVELGQPGRQHVVEATFRGLRQALEFVRRENGPEQLVPADQLVFDADGEHHLGDLGSRDFVQGPGTPLPHRHRRLVR